MLTTPRRIATCPARASSCSTPWAPGSFPDAAEFGDEGSDTLGNVAKAVGGLDLPTSRRSASATSSRSKAALPGRRPRRRRPAGRAVEGQGHHARPLGDDGHRHAAGASDLSARLPARGHRPVHAPDGPRRARQQAGVAGRRSSRSSGRSTRRRGNGSSTRPPTRSSRSPLTRRRSRSTSCTTAAGSPVRSSIGKHAVGRVIARPFIGEPGNYERTPNRHDFSLEPRRPNYLTLVREAGEPVHGVGKIPDIFAQLDIDEEHPTKSNVEGITTTETAAARARRRASSSPISSRRTCSGATGTTRSTSTAACRTSTGGCPICWMRCGTAIC